MTQQAPDARFNLCPECGAAQTPLTCRQRLELLLAWEVDDAELSQKHFLTVASFNLQHPAAFTEEARAGLEEALDGYLDGHLTIAAIRQRASKAARIHRPAGEVRPRRRDWPVTLDMVAVPGQPRDAAARVLSWAESIRRSRIPPSGAHGS